LAAGTGLTLSHFKSNGESSDIAPHAMVIPIAIGALAFWFI